MTEEFPQFPSRSPTRTRDAGKDFAEPEERTPDLIERLAVQSSHVLVKKLATNDRQWAIRNPLTGKFLSNQAGPLMPAEARTSGFFPPLTPDPERPANHKAQVRVYWPATGKVYESNFTWWSGKGPAENHLTINPRSEFDTLAPASYLLIFKSKDTRAAYRALTVDADDEALIDYIFEVFDIREDFHFRIYDAASLKLQPALTLLQQVVEDLARELARGPKEFEEFVLSLKRRSPPEISAAAFEQWTRDTGNAVFDPFALACPGDALYDLTRNREFAIYKEDEARSYGAQLALALLGGGRPVTPKDLIGSLVQRFDAFYGIFLRASQARVSRVGGSFETHMKTALSTADIPHAPQYVFDGSKPDFVLPSGPVYADPVRRSNLALVLTLKTTLRERWKQVVSESTGCPIFLATLDESVPGSTLDKLAAKNIALVVPERFKTSEYAEYAKRPNVLTYRSFFDELRASRGPAWLAEGIGCFKQSTGRLFP